MAADAVYTFDTLNDTERTRLAQRQLTAEDFTVVKISFDSLQPHKVATASRFASMRSPTNDWSLVHLILPLRLNRAAGDDCALASSDRPRLIRLVIRENRLQAAIRSIVREMGVFDLTLTER